LNGTRTRLLLITKNMVSALGKHKQSSITHWLVSLMMRFIQVMSNEKFLSDIQ